MTILPASGYWENNARTEGEGKQWGEDVRDVIAELLGGAAATQLTIVSGAIVPTLGCHTIEGEGAASDDLMNITTTNTPDGRLLLITAYNAAHVITVKHAAGGAGQIHLQSSADVVLDATTKWVLLKRTGADWYEIMWSHHAARHERAGAAEIDGDHLDIDWNPTYSVPATTPSEAANVNDLTAHLYGLDIALGWFTMGYKQRSQFTYNGGVVAYTIKAEPAMYMCKEKVCQWKAELTTGAIGTPAADDWYYLYLDYSGITSGTAITTSELIWSNTEPAWNDTYAAWYNGDDRCIFAVRTNGTPNNILEFFHNGDFCVYADMIIDHAAASVSSWEDVVLTIPKFTKRAECTFSGTAAGGDLESAFWRTNGQTGSTGHRVYRIDDDNAKAPVNTCIVMTDISQTIEIDDDSNGTIEVATDGFYLPDSI